MTTELEPLDGRTIAQRILDNRDDFAALSFWAGVGAARLMQYQARLEAHGIALPESDDEARANG